MREKPVSMGAESRPEFLGLEIRATDILLLSTIVLFTLLPLFFPSRVKNWPGVILTNVLAVFIYWTANFLGQRSQKQLVKFLLRTASVQLLLLYLYKISLLLQQVFFTHWNDQAVLDLEQHLFGGQHTIWMQRIMSPGLTEWLLFCYVFYVPIYPILSAIIYYKHGEKEMEDYLFYLGLAVVLSGIGFMFSRVAGPMHKIGLLYSVPLRGYVFTAIGEYIRSHVHMPGGAFPSIHCAAATIMWWMAYRYSRVSFYVLAPVILSLYISTVYGRYHYLVDVIGGIIVAFIIMALGHALIEDGTQAKVKR